MSSPASSTAAHARPAATPPLRQERWWRPAVSDRACGFLPGATTIIRPRPAGLAQSVCRTSSLPMEVSTAFGPDLNCS